MKKTPFEKAAKIIWIWQYRQLNERLEQLRFERMLRQELRTMPPLRRRPARAQ